LAVRGKIMEYAAEVERQGARKHMKSESTRLREMSGNEVGVSGSGGVWKCPEGEMGG
jgi:hypothetical protein